MGYAYYQLVPAAIMHDNPGLTREQLSSVFMQTNMHTGEIPLYRLVDQSWRSELKEVRKEHPPDLEAGFVWGENPYRDRTEKEKRAFISKNNLALWNNQNSNLFREGERVDNYHVGLYGLGRILCLKKKVNDDHLEFRYGSDFLRTREIKVIFDNWRGLSIFFPSMKSLIEHRSFSPDKVFDFSQKEGHFSNLERSAQIYRWYQKNGRYYFDYQRMVDNLDVAGFDDSMREYGEPCSFTDFVVTLEATRKKAWKMLSYNGLSHQKNFFRKWPESKSAYEKAIWDSHTSLVAKKDKLKVRDFLRNRLLAKTEATIAFEERRLQEVARERGLDGD